MGQERITVWQELMELELSQKYVDVNGVRTRVLEAGAGPPLILLHGTGGHLEAYARVIGPLAEVRRVIVFDMLGHGLTDRPDVPYSIGRLSDHLIGLMDALGLDACDLSGESMGAWVAAWTAAHHKNRVRRLILNTPGNVTNKPQVMDNVTKISKRAAADPTDDAMRDRLEWLFEDTTYVTDELIGIRGYIYRQEGFANAVDNMLIMQDPEYREYYSWEGEWCRGIESPTLLVWTSADPTGGLEEAALLNAWIPESTLHVIQDVGHWPQWEAANQFVDVVKEFLS